MQIIENLNWAKSAKKAAIPLYKSESTSAPIIIIGGVHGDEPEGVWLAEATLEWLKRNTVQSSWIVVPCINPDGFANNERVNGNGVDLNRNYPSRDWSAKFERPRYNPGSAPGSEPEVQALIRLIKDVGPRLIIHYHSWHPCIVCAGEPGRPAAEALAKCSGYELKSEIGYPTPGSLSQYGWHDNRIPVICIEEAEGTAQKDVWPHFQDGIKKIFTEPL